MLLDQQGEPVCSYHYSAFGEFIHEGFEISPWLFSGQRYDPTTELYVYAKRNYDPAIGRWLTPDPIGFADGPNLYAYVHNNPLTYVDPYGLWSFSLESKNFLSGFSRGFVDDTSFGASNYFLGHYNAHSLSSKIGYYTGTGCSLAAGLVYGGTELKALRGVVKGGSYLGKTGYELFRGTNTAKTVFMGGKELSHVAKITELSSTTQKTGSVFQRSFGSKEGVGNSLWLSSKSGADYARHLRYSQDYGKEGMKFLQNGRIRYYGQLKPPKAPGEMIGARYVHEFNPLRGSSRGWMETLDSSSRTRLVRPQSDSGYKTHYLFDKSGNLENIW